MSAGRGDAMSEMVPYLRQMVELLDDQNNGLKELNEALRSTENFEDRLMRIESKLDELLMEIQIQRINR